jgi:hypothetical protein
VGIFWTVFGLVTLGISLALLGISIYFLKRAQAILHDANEIAAMLTAYLTEGDE